MVVGEDGSSSEGSMANKVQSKCLGCGDIFTADARNEWRSIGTLASRRARPHIELIIAAITQDFAPLSLVVTFHTRHALSA
jgi:hypothetical protein